VTEAPPRKAQAVQVFPDGFQVRQESPDNLPKQRGFLFTKSWWRFRHCLRLCLRGIWAPLISPGALFGFLTIPFLMFFIFVLAGKAEMMEKLGLLFASTLAVVATLPVWAVLNLIVAPFRAVADERKTGDWQGQRFIYYEPKLLATSVFSPDDNGKYAEIRGEGIPPGAVIDYKIEIEGPANRITCLVFGTYFFAPAIETLKAGRFALRGRVVLRKDGTLRLIGYSLPGTLRAIVRVYALSWEWDSGLLMEYTDESKGLRFVIRPPGTDGEMNPA